MNAKKAKALRREARDASIGLPAAGYAAGKRTRIQIKRIDRKGEEQIHAVLHTTFRVSAETTRGRYQALKRKAG